MGTRDKAQTPILSRFLPDTADEGVLRRSRAIAMSALTIGCTGLLFVIMHLAMGLWLLASFTSVGVAGCAIALLILPRCGPALTAHILTAAGWLCLSLDMVLFGGFSQPFIFWLAILPPIGGLLGGRRAALIWGGITGLTLLGFQYAQMAQIPLPQSIHFDELPAVLSYAQTVGIVTCITATVVLFLHNQAWAEARMHRAITALEAEVAARREAEAEARVAAQARGCFLATMSHELRTPMNGVLGMAQLLEWELSDPEQLEQIGIIRESGELMMHHIDRILDFSKLDSGAVALEDEPLSPRSLIGGVIATASAEAREKGLLLRESVGPEVPATIRGDETRLRQVLLNLVSNAVKFTERGEVCVSVSAGSGRLRVAVRDSGIGIPEEHRARLFDPFVQADASTTRRFGGTGLGLAIAKRLVEAMGGAIAVDSTPGVGSTFTVELPAVEVTPRAAPEVAEIAPLPDGPRVLVAEDDPTSALIVSGMLSLLQCPHLCVTDGAEACAALASGEDFGLVLMDLHMPELDGIQATRHIREVLGSDIPIVALSASVLESDRLACLDAGMDGFLSKPVRLDQLAAVLRGDRAAA